MDGEIAKQLGEMSARIGAVSELVEQQTVQVRGAFSDVLGVVRDLRAEVVQLRPEVEEQGVKFRGVLSDVLGVVRDLPAEMVELRREMISPRTDLHDYRALDERLRTVETALKTR